MASWMLFWTIVLYAGLVMFVIMSVYVTIFGFRDIKRMLRELRESGESGESRESRDG